MRKFDVQIALEGVREDNEKWKAAFKKFNADYNKVMTRLLHEAAANFMSAEEFAKHAGLRTSQVKRLMRSVGLNPTTGKTLLAKTASTALATNADLLGIPVHEMDLMSPLAYLPMGSEMRQRLTDATVHTVTELPDEVSDGAFDALANVIYNAMPWEGETYQAVAESLARVVIDAGWR